MHMPKKPKSVESLPKKAVKEKSNTEIIIPNPYSGMATVKESATFQLFREYWDSTNNTDPEGMDKLLNKFGNSTTWVYIAVKRISDAMAQIPWQVVRQVGGRDQVVRTYDKGILQLLTKPNPYQTWFDFIEDMVTDLELTGNAFIELVSDARDRPFEMYALNPARITIVPDKKKYVAGYVYAVNGRKIGFDYDDIIHIKYNHPNNDYYGFSPLTAARIAIDLDMTSSEWNQRFLNHGSWPAGSIETENDLEDSEIKRLQRQIKTTMQVGKDQAGRVLLLTGGMKYNKLGLTPKDTEWMDGRRMSRDEILAIFGVPYAVAGLFSTEQTTARSAGVELQIKQFYRTTIFSKVEKIFGTFNRALIPRFREDVKLVPNYRSIPALQEEVDQEFTRAQALEKLVSAGLSLNKALQRLYPDVDPEPWGDIAWLSQSLVPISGPEAYEPEIEDTAEDTAEDAAEGETEDPGKTDNAFRRIPDVIQRIRNRAYAH